MFAVLPASCVKVASISTADGVIIPNYTAHPERQSPASDNDLNDKRNDTDSFASNPSNLYYPAAASFFPSPSFLLSSFLSPLSHWRAWILFVELQRSNLNLIHTPQLNSN